MQPASEARTEVRSTVEQRTALFIVWAAGAAYLWSLLRLGWVPHDDGALAQAAEWVNQGRLPHRDFIDVYTGGLSWLHALAFRVLGTSLLTIRIVLFVAFLAWVPAVFYIASRLARPAGAALVTALAIVWSVPNYPAGLPSWYNLFLATFGVAALCRYIDDRRVRWLFVAGVAGGLSFLMKVIGLYYVAGVLLFLVFHSQTSDDSAAGEERTTNGTAYAVFVSCCLAAFVLGLILLVRRALRPAEVMHFVVPGALIAAFVAHQEWSHRAISGGRRFRALWSRLAPFLGGVAVPITLFLVPYLLSSSLGAFVDGVFLMPMRRFTFAAQPALPVQTLWALVPVIVAGLLWQRIPDRLQRSVLMVIAILLAGLLIWSGSSNLAYRAVWYAVRDLLPVLTLVGVAALARERANDSASMQMRERAMLILSVTAVCTLVQFPFASSIYLAYVAPLVGLSALALLALAPARYRAPAAVVGGFLIAFAVLRANLTDIRSIGQEYRAPLAVRPLASGRGGISVPVEHAAVYEALASRLRALSPGGVTWAYPDAPEVYFLSGLESIGRTPFDFFDPRAKSAILEEIDARGVTAVVIHTAPPFSPAIDEALYRDLARRFPRGQKMGPFLLLWRE